MKPSLEELKQKSAQAADEMNDNQFAACLWEGIIKVLDGIGDIVSALDVYVTAEKLDAQHRYQRSTNTYRQLNEQLQRVTRKKNNETSK